MAALVCAPPAVAQNPGAKPAPAAADASQPVARAAATMARGDYAAAEKELAAIGGKDRGAAQLLLAELQLTVGRYADAEKTARAAAGAGKDARLRAAALRAQALAATGKLGEAIAAVREVEKDDEARRARLVLGELLIESGKRGEAQAPLMTLIQDYNDDRIPPTDAEALSLVGRAAHLLRSARDANEAYQDAEKAGGKERVETLLWRADLFMDKYDPGHAGAVVKEALKLAPRNPGAHVAMAEVKLESSMDFEAAESEVKQALEVNPNLPAAYAVRAGLALRDMDITGAEAAIARGLAVNPNHLDLLSLRAAARFLADDKAGFEAAKKEVLSRNPGYARFFQIVAEYAEWEHRYDDIVKMMNEATGVDKNDPKVLATLGINLLRGGDEAGGLAALRSAWQKDKFNVRVFNTLNLYEQDIASQYVTVDGQPFKIRYAKAEKAVLERYVPRMLGEAWRSMVERYGFTPKQPVGIELYADPQHFSVRTSGLPNVGIQGVCFGPTLAALSPGAAPFNWGNVLWHELGHVFAIQMSKNHVPRWFTEGLSEYETIVRRPEWQREEDPALFAAFKAGRVPAVEGFNRAFTHVDSVDDVTMAYYAASQIVVFMAKEFGFPKVVGMLPRWGAGQRTGEVVRGSLGISPEELDRRFRAWLEPRLGRYRQQYVPDLHAPPLDDARKAALAAPKDARKLVSLALALLADDQEAEAQAVLAEALRLDPKQPDAHYIKLRVAFSAKKAPEAAALINKMVADGHDGYAVRMRAADLAELHTDDKRLKANLEAAAKFDPSQAEPLQGLYDLAHKKSDVAGELAALRKLALIDQHDRKVWRLLLTRLLERGQWEEARKVGEGAIFVDVMSSEVHRLYARALARTGNFVSAVYELNSAILCGPKPADLARIYAELETAYGKLGKPDYAKQAADLAKRIRAGLDVDPAPLADL
ncbi:MAG: tetratricopeptide repeat protein [Polyangiaceae bacterium]